MTGFKPRTSGVRSDHSTNWATTTAPFRTYFGDPRCWCKFVVVDVFTADVDVDADGVVVDDDSAAAAPAAVVVVTFVIVVVVIDVFPFTMLAFSSGPGKSVPAQSIGPGQILWRNFKILFFALPVLSSLFGLKFSNSHSFWML